MLGAVVLCGSGSVFLLFFFLDDEAEVAAACIYSAVGGSSSRDSRSSGSRAGVAHCRGRVNDEEAGALPISRSDGSSVPSSCPHSNTVSEGTAGRAMGPVDLTAATHRLDGTLDFNTWI